MTALARTITIALAVIVDQRISHRTHTLMIRAKGETTHLTQLRTTRPMVDAITMLPTTHAPMVTARRRKIAGMLTQASHRRTLMTTRATRRVEVSEAFLRGRNLSKLL